MNIYIIENQYQWLKQIGHRIERKQELYTGGIERRKRKGEMMQLCFNLKIKMQEEGWRYNSIVKWLTDIRLIELTKKTQVF